VEDLARRHLRIGWWTLLVFLSLGILLEALHGFKIGFSWISRMRLAATSGRSAHAHARCSGLVNLGFAASLKLFCDGRERWTSLASAALIGATILLPGGFLPRRRRRLRGRPRHRRAAGAGRRRAAAAGRVRHGARPPRGGAS
jgi:hypothetical protein